MTSKYWIIFISILYTVSGYAQERTWYESFYSDKKLDRKYKIIKDKIPAHEFKSIFNKDKLRCEPQIIKELITVGPANIKYAVILANQKEYIDEVETDILLGYLNYIKSDFNVDQDVVVKKGSKSVERHYKNLFQAESCISDNWKTFSAKVTLHEKNKDQDALKLLNRYAFEKKYLSKNQFRVVEMLRLHSQNINNGLSIKDYHKKQKSLRENGFKLNAKVMPFHNAIRDKNEASSRYNIYSKFNTLQMKEMILLINNMEERFKAASSEVIFIDEDGEIQEKIKLNHTEKLRLSLKLYSREKNELLLKDYFKDVNFSYRDLITLSYETDQITDSELEVFEKLEKRTKKKSFWQKAVDFATRLDFLAATLGGPVAGIGYSLTISFVNNLVNKPNKEKKASFEHDLFYGNCEMKL